jgi:hypothetical protein
MPTVESPNFGLLNGLADGVKQGLITYQTMKGIQHTQQMQELAAGVQKNPQTGALEMSPEMQAHKQAGLLQDQSTIAGFDPTSEHSQKMAGARGILAQAGNKSIPKDIYSNMSANEQKEIEPLVKTDVSGNYGVLKAMFNPMAGVKREQLEESKNQHASEAGNNIAKDKIIMGAKQNIGALKRSLSILDNPNKPVLATDLALAYNDYMNAVAIGGQATEGKIHREMPNTWEQKWNTVKQNAGVNDDLRTSPEGAELINMLKENIRTVHHDWKEAAANQGKFLQSNYAQSNPKVQSVVNQKVKELTAPDPHPQDNEALAWAKANRNDPRAKQILEANGAM